MGKYLKQAREKKSYTLEDMTELTNIEKKYLQALEKEEYDLLPSPFYARVFLKTYAKYLNLNISSLLQLYESSQMAKQSSTPIKPKIEAVELPKRSPAKKKKISSLWLIVAIILILGMVYMLFQ
ncbi:helix-turn-helix domain-containing protein [Shimazuella sp. AN120528]|uniref:helix-turn-helix domain-containing protein n=1 Tax=Shimazuella soli TaxID=1892854 RepID=UPI001F1086E6|nr:helix-turn-helix domain-containing protein [Shimazuella soli]